MRFFWIFLKLVSLIDHLKELLNSLEIWKAYQKGYSSAKYWVFRFVTESAVQGVDKNLLAEVGGHVGGPPPERGLIPCSDTRRGLTDADDESGAQFGVRRKEARVRSWVKKKHRLGRRGRKGEGEGETETERAGIGVRVWEWRWRWSRSRPISCNSLCCWPETLGGGRPWSSLRTPRHIPCSSPSPSFWPRNTSPRCNCSPVWFLASVAAFRPINVCRGGMFVADSRFKFLVSVYAGRWKGTRAVAIVMFPLCELSVQCL